MPRIHDPKPFSEHFLDRICEFPKQMRSYEDAMRLYHLDLAGFTDEKLLRERRLAQQRCDLDARRRGWFRERVAAIDDELNRRREELRRRSGPAAITPNIVPSRDRSLRESVRGEQSPKGSGAPFQPIRIVKGKVVR